MVSLIPKNKEESLIIENDHQTIGDNNLSNKNSHT